MRNPDIPNQNIIVCLLKLWHNGNVFGPYELYVTCGFLPLKKPSNKHDYNRGLYFWTFSLVFPLRVTCIFVSQIRSVCKSTFDRLSQARL